MNYFFVEKIMPHYSTLRLILGDQLNSNHSWFTKTDPSVLYVLMEIRPESEYVTHHIQKILGIFGAMRAFAKDLEKRGHRVRYFRIGEEDNRQSFGENLNHLITEHGIDRFEYLEPDEYRLDQLLKNFANSLDISVECLPAEHFISVRTDLEEFFTGKKTYLLESYYRELRKKHDVLMEDGQPACGKWNYDQENRKKLPVNVLPPQPLVFNHDLSDLYEEIREAGLPSLGNVDPKNFIWPINRREGLELLEFFLEYLLPSFGTYQDALTESSWSVYHSRISFALNTKMLHPMEVVRAVEKRWKEDDQVSISQAEGFIRQILGWREYMRGIYWAKMPEYAGLNHFNADRKLPDYFWTGDTDMRCVQKAVQQSLDHAYAHHIQRLMVTGNFCTLTGINPDEVDRWYLGIYIDAFEWVEITNTRGMSQFADGGIVGTKPYVSSASYLHKMGHHCNSCRYDYKKKLGEDACPFNSLYWDFIDRHQEEFKRNPRMSMMVRTWEKMEKKDILEKAGEVLERLENL